MKICSKCILPESFPMIRFDKNGVCNYCLDYKKIIVKGGDELEKILNKFRNQGCDFDCVVGSGGGRDSAYVIHQLVKKYKMRVLMFTYDWGLMTPEAHRNLERISKILNIKHVIIRPNAEKIKKHISINIKVWLRRPQLGMIPVFTMADKAMGVQMNKVARKYGIKLIVSGTNRYETTHFKTAFCGINETRLGGMTSAQLANIDKIKLLFFYFSQYIKNPRYINSSLVEMIKSFFYHYFANHSKDIIKIFFYDYIMWDENTVLSIIRKDLNWEAPKDTTMTWRTDDGTAAFYNYICYMVAGFTENDTFRGNQIRQGILTREEVFILLKEENKPRFESIKWYCDTIGIDFESTIKTINEISKFY